MTYKDKKRTPVCGSKSDGRSCKYVGFSRFLLVVILFRSFVYKIHELVKLRSDNNLRATVALLAEFAVVCCERVVFSASSRCEAFGIDAVIVLQVLHNT